MKNIVTFLTLVSFISCTSQTPSEYVLDEKDLVSQGIAYSANKEVFNLNRMVNSKVVAYSLP